MTIKKFLPLLLGVLAAGCYSVKVSAPAVETPKQAVKVKQAREQLKLKKQTAKEIPSVLGGIVQSDSWIIYKDKQQEEFSGNVSYDNGAYVFKADYALSERALNRITARGNVYVKQTEKDGSFYEAFAGWARYNYQTQKGSVKGTKKVPVKLVYRDEKNQLTTALADYIDFDLGTRTFELAGNVRVVREGPESTQHLSADNVFIRQDDNYVRLTGNAKLNDNNHSLEADEIVYDGAHNAAYSQGGRVLAEGSAQQGRFAIIADKVASDSEGNTIELDGRVQGWLVSPELKKTEKTAPHI